MPMEPGVRGRHMLAETQDDSSLVRSNGVGTASEPYCRHYPDDKTEELWADLLQP